MTTATKYKTYPKYKPSGIDWLGNIPEGWEVKDLKYLLDRNDGGVWGEDFDDDGTPVLRSTEIDISGEWILDEFATRKLTPQEKQKALLKEGDLLITKSSGSELHIGKTALVNKEIDDLECCFSNFMQRLRPNKDVSSKLLFYFFNSYIAREQYNYFSQSTTGLANLSEGLFGQIIFVKIPESEQKIIVSFLDRETAKIDEMVAKKQKMIELLREKRQALITHAVTKGLSSFAKASADKDPKAKMKPSGIDWLGDIPEGWEVKRLRFVIKTNPSKQEIYFNLPELEVSFIPMEAVSEEGNVDLSITKPIEEVIDGYTYFRDYDVVIAKITPCYENGKGAIMNNLTNGVGFGTTEFHVLRSSDIDSKYLYLITRIYPFRAFGEVNMKGAAGQKRVPEDFIKDFSLGLPKIDEQKQIVAFLDRETAKIDEMVKKTELQIEKLQEYRQALITSAVTGKIMVN